jgi:signal transduction histidine kinase
MSEPHASEPEQEAGRQGPSPLYIAPKLPASDTATAASSTQPLSFTTGKLGFPRVNTMQPLLETLANSSNRAPIWMRPFFSLRVQLIAAYIISLLFVVMLLCILIYQQTDMLYISAMAMGCIILGSLITFALITLLLRPLWRVTDVAQAIAIGDLKQRERLPMRLPPQDEIDRLSGSLNEMVVRLERAEELQHASEQHFTRFFSDASHQLRTPLTSIRGFTEVLMRGAKDDPDTAQRVLKRMKNEAERMTTLINNMLTLARLDDSQLMKKQYVDLADIANDGLEHIRTRANAERSITLTITTQEACGLQGDKERLKQLLFILLDNALKYGRQTADSQVTVELVKQGNLATIRVIDDGEGISAKDMGHIFDAFYRGTPHASSSVNGTPPAGVGLGLTIAAAIVRAHDGTITATSEAGKGSVFSVALPCLA